MSNIWFTSDTHFGHTNIVKGVSKWTEGGMRDFKTLEEHNEYLISQFNKYVKKEDVLYHLGDWSFGGIENIWNFRKRLNIEQIHLMFGNHDHHIENNRTLPNVLNPRGAKNIFSSTQYVYDNKIGSTSFFLSHYAHRIWNKSHHGKIHLYGHSHDSLDKHPNKPWGKSMDVGIDSAKRILGEYRPFHIDEILKIMKKREIYFPDHHNSKTN